MQINIVQEQIVNKLEIVMLVKDVPINKFVNLDNKNNSKVNLKNKK